MGMIMSLIILTSCSSSMKSLKTVPDVDLNRYTGKWYEIARLPNSFEKGLVCCTAEYALRPDGKISVTNSGVKEDEPGKMSSVNGKAWVPDKNEPGRLKVQFFWPFSGGYYIFHLDEENYQVIGSRKGQQFKLGDKVRIKVKKIDLPRKQMDFGLVL